VLLPGVAVGWRWLRERFGDHSPSPRPLRFRPDPDPLGIGRRLRHHVTSVVQRANSSDVAAGVHIATTTGGGRIATVGTIVGLCVSSLGAGAICVVTGVLHLDLDPPHHPVAVVHPTVTVAPVRHARALSTELVAVHSSPTPSPTPRPHRAVARPRHRPTAAAPRTPPATTSQQAPISPAPPQPAAQEFAAAPASGAGTRTPPAAAPSTGGEEFAP
jgi:hypothetical protein